MTKQFTKDAFGWGFILWLIGYALGILLFTVVPLSLVGWIIMPIGTIITIWVLVKKVKADSFQYYALLAVIWTLIAVVLITFSSSKRSSRRTDIINWMSICIT